MRTFSTTSSAWRRVGSVEFRLRDDGVAELRSPEVCDKLDCNEYAVGEAHGSLLYHACAEHLPEIQAKVDRENAL